MILHSLNNSSKCNQLGFIAPIAIPLATTAISYVVAGNVFNWGYDDAKNDEANVQNRSRSLDSILEYTWKVINYNYCQGKNIPWWSHEPCGIINGKPIDIDRLKRIYFAYVSEALKHGEYVGPQNKEQSEKIINIVANTAQEPKELVRDFLGELYAQWHYSPRRVSTDMFIYPNKTTEKSLVREEGRKQAELIDNEARKEYENKDSFWNSIKSFFSGTLEGFETAGKITFWGIIIIGVGLLLVWGFKFFATTKVGSTAINKFTQNEND